MHGPSSGYGVANERQFSNESIERLAKDALFDFQIQSSAVSVRVAELHELLLRGRGEPDLADLLDEFVHELEDEIHAVGGNALFLLAALQHFRQQMEWLLELDQDAQMAPSSSQEAAMTKNIFASRAANEKATTPGKQRPVNASPMRKTAITTASPRTSPGRKREPRQTHAHIPPPSQQQQQQREKLVTRGADDDVVCGVCFQADSLEHDPIVICDLCNIAVHQSCYRIEELPEEDWFCRPCQLYLHAKDIGTNVTPTYELQCTACRGKGGAFIATIDDQWVHMACSMFLPELYVQASHRHPGEEAIGGIEQLQARRTLRCSYCKKKNKGACAQCCVGKCATSYHVICALQNNTKFVFMDDKDQFGSACMRHHKAFYGKEPSTTPTTTHDQETKRSKKTTRPTATGASAVASSSPRKKTGMKAQKKLPRRRGSVTSDGASSDEDDGILLDEESDKSSMFSSDVDSDASDHAPPRQKKQQQSPARPTTTSRTAAAARSQPPLQQQQQRDAVSPSQRKSPVRGGSGARPLKKQQTLMVPAFGMVKQLSKPSGVVLPASSPFQQQPAAHVAKPTPTVANMKMVTKTTQIFVPFSGAVVESGSFEEVLLVIPTVPLGLSLKTESRAHGVATVLQGHQSSTHNLVVSDALRRGVLQDGDDVVAINDVAMRNRDVSTLKELLASFQPPFRIWLRLKNKRSLASFGIASSLSAAQNMATHAPSSSLNVTPAKRGETVKQTVLIPVMTETKTKTPLSNDGKPPPAAAASTTSLDRTPMDDALSMDWPWFYLRSDGKLAMNLMWKSLDAGFFVSKFDPTTWTKMLNNVESLLGFRLSTSHVEYASTTLDLLYFPSREFPVPKYIQDFRENKKQKRQSLAHDSVFLNSELEQVDGLNEDEWDTKPPLEVGVTVHVAKRTWPGINKLGGAGRVRKVHQEKSDDGQKTRYLYDIAYVLGGSEKKVERKYIAALKDNQQTPTKQPETNLETAAAAGTEEKQAISSKADDAAEDDCVRLRLGMRLEVRDQEVELPVMTRSAERKVHVQVSVLTNSVSLERDVDAATTISGGNSQSRAASKREMLWHQHFPVKQSGGDALLSDALAGSLEFVEELAEDGEGDSDADDGVESEVATQLLQAQAEFKYIMARNDALFAALQTAVEAEYATKQYRKRKLDEIQWKHYDQMYREMDAARKQFEDDSDDDSGSDGDGKDAHGASGGGRSQAAPSTGSRQETKDSDDADSDDQDDSCGGMFVNKIKQEGNEVCVLCELTGGDFAATSCSRVVHPQCAMYTPETFFKDGIAHGLDKIPVDERRALTCSICGGKNGLSKIQCGNQRCVTAFHVSCAYVNGLLTRDPHYQAWCPKHLKSSGMQGEIEWPPHLKPKWQHQQHQPKATPATSPRRGGGASQQGGAISSKRKRSRGAKEESSGSASGQRRRPPVTTIDVDETGEGGGDDADALAERNCARRLVIDVDDSDDQDKLGDSFKKTDQKAKAKRANTKV